MRISDWSSDVCSSDLPCTPLANSTISPAWTLSRPWTRAMPSPTESTEPISLTVASVPKLAIWSLMTLLISAARISIIQPFIGGIWAYGLSALHRLRENIETGTDAAVDQLAARLDDEASSDERRRGKECARTWKGRWSAVYYKKIEK